MCSYDPELSEKFIYRDYETKKRHLNKIKEEMDRDGLTCYVYEAEQNKVYLKLKPLDKDNIKLIHNYVYNRKLWPEDLQPTEQSTPSN